ncbi:MAG: hypothetical protein U5N55_02940 [Cypionkella sp.]|nr:hypothetical protein [Cypionkella sp.]
MSSTPTQRAGGGQDGRSRAGQETVALQKMLAAMDLHRAALHQRGANGVGAPVRFVPRGAAGQRHTLGLAHKTHIAQGVHEHAVLVGQHHHALAVAHLLKHIFHDRARVGQQRMAVGQRLAQAGATRMVGGSTAGGRQACGQTAVPRAG